jgi:hypothetical protein
MIPTFRLPLFSLMAIATDPLLNFLPIDLPIDIAQVFV